MAIKIPLDFTGVESSNRVKVTPGDYLAKVIKVEQTKSSNKGTPELRVTFEGKSGELSGRRFTDSHYLTQKSLWTLRNMLEAIGYKVKPSKMTFSDSMVKGKIVGVTLVDDEYEGRVRSIVADYIPSKAVTNRVAVEESSELMEEEDESADEDDLFEEDEDDLEGDEVEEDEEDEEVEEDTEEVEEEETSDETPPLTFTPEEVSEAKGADLVEYLKEAMAEGWEFDLPKKPKVAQVREALLALFVDEEDGEDEEDLESWDLDDLDD